MPDVRIYIRTEDMNKWQSIKRKSEFIHNALNDKDLSPSIDLIDVPSGEEPEQLYTIAVKDSGIAVKKNLTLQAAEKWLEMNNPNGELDIFPQ